MPFTNIYSVYYAVDIAQNLVIENINQRFNSHMLKFIEEKLSRLYFLDKNREYLKIDDTTQVVSMLNKIINTENDTLRKTASKTIADRLLREEISVQARISQLNRDIQRGGLIISYFEYDTQQYIAIVKIHYIDFYEEATFEESRGLPKKDVILKTFISKITNNLTDIQFFLSDSTKKEGEGSAKFWWNNFLELKELRSDKENTKESFEQVEQVLKKEFYTNNREDFWYLKNNLIAYYRLSEQFSFTTMIDSTIGDMDLKLLNNKTDEEKQTFKNSLKSKLQSVSYDSRGNRRFDTEFTIDKKEVKAKIKTKITLMPNVDLNLLGEVEDFQAKIIPTLDEQNRKYLKIYSDEGYDKFKS